MRSSVRRYSVLSLASPRRAQSASPFTHAAARAARTFHIARMLSSRWKRWSRRSSVLGQPIRYSCSTRCSTRARTSFTRSKSERCGEPMLGSSPASAQVVTSATGKSRLICAFIPASANWSGAIPRVERHSKSGAQARGASRGLCSWPRTASKKRSTKATSSFSRKRGSSKLALAKLRLHCLRHREVEAREARDAISLGQRLEDRLHASDHDGDGVRRAFYVPHVPRYERPGQAVPLRLREVTDHESADLSFEVGQVAPEDRFPQAHRAIVASGRDRAAVGAEGDAGDASRHDPAAVRAEGPGGRGRPTAARFRPNRRRRVRGGPSGRNASILDALARMPIERLAERGASTGGVPQAHGPVGAARGETCARPRRSATACTTSLRRRAGGSPAGPCARRRPTRGAVSVLAGRRERAHRPG